jgi:hypothetical protein
MKFLFLSGTQKYKDLGYVFMCAVSLFIIGNKLGIVSPYLAEVA